jgi:hypothetical protein
VHGGSENGCSQKGSIVNAPGLGSPLDPQRLTPSVSMNRVRIVDLPGLVVDPEVKGRNGSQLVSAAVLAQLIRQYAGSLQLDPTVEDHELRLALDGCLVCEDATVRIAAEMVGQRLGRNLGYILLTLKRGDAVDRAARTEWDDSYWSHWGKIDRAWLGGGLVSGRLGPVIRKHAQALFEEAGIGDYAIQISPYGSALPMVGVARRVPPASETALVFDFGSTLIKCARAVYKNGEVTELWRLPSHPAGWARIERASDDPVGQADQLLGYMVSAITRTWRAAGLSPGSPILASAAAYVQDGHPLPVQHRGGYVQLRRITDNLQAELAQRVGAELGEAIDVSLVHDGTAAATTYAGAKTAAVITVGTAMGVGFPPPAGGLMALSPNLVIRSPSASLECVSGRSRVMKL